MWRLAATVMTVLFLAGLTVEDATSQQHGKGSMKGMEHKSMKHAPVGACMHPLKPLPAKPKGFKEGKIVILQPKNGAVIKSRTVKVVFDIPEKGDWGNHVHIYLDGRCRNMIRSGHTHYLGGLREGKHKVELRLVTNDHHEYGPSASAGVTVKLK